MIRLGMTNPSLPGPSGRRPGRRPGDGNIQRVKRRRRKVTPFPKTRAPRRRKSVR